MAFNLKRQVKEVKEGWTSFNQRHNERSEMTSIGYMPIVQERAQDLDTLRTFVLKCKQVAKN